MTHYDTCGYTKGQDLFSVPVADSPCIGTANVLMYKVCFPNFHGGSHIGGAPTGVCKICLQENFGVGNLEKVSADSISIHLFTRGEKKWHPRTLLFLEKFPVGPYPYSIHNKNNFLHVYPRHISKCFF